MAKQIIDSEHSRQAILRGVNQLAERGGAVRILAPRAATSYWRKNSADRTSRRTGVTVAKIELKDPLENMGAQMVREVASKTSYVPATAQPPPPFWSAIYREG